jgi:hypothetical protein
VGGCLLVVGHVGVVTLMLLRASFMACVCQAWTVL